MTRFGLISMILAIQACNGSSSPSQTMVAGSTTVAPAPSSSSSAPPAPKADEKPKLDAVAALELCKKGDGPACSTACDHGDLPSCITFAEALLSGSDRTAKAACEAPLKKACDGNIGRACSALARCRSAVIAAEGRNTYIKDKRERVALNEKACTLRDGLGCFEIAKSYEEANGVEHDDAKAKALMKEALSLLPKQCDQGDGKSCLSLAMLHDPNSASTRLPKSDAKAKALYEKACEAGEDLACGFAKAGAK